MTVRAIFYVAELSITPQHDAGPPKRIGTAKLRAVAKGPYKHWSAWTPHGELSIGTLNEKAFAWFEEHLGRDVAITFDEPTAADLASD